MATQIQKKDEKKENGSRTIEGAQSPQPLQRGSSTSGVSRMPTPFSVLNPFSMMRRLFDDLERFMDNGSSEVTRSQDPMMDTGMMFAPRVDVVRRDDKLVVHVDLPGMAPEDVRIMIEDDALVVDGERRVERVYEESDVMRAERSYGRFRRVIPLPESVEQDSAEARFDNGVLEISLRAPESSKRGRQIEIKSGGQSKPSQSH